MVVSVPLLNSLSPTNFGLWMHLLYRNSLMTPGDNSPRSNASQKGRRSLQGCLTCRARHVKCTLEQPACSNCLRLSIICNGYRPQLKWLVYGSQDGENVVILHGNERTANKSVSRREIFTVSERRCMSQSLIDSVREDRYTDVIQSINVILKDLERQSFLYISSRDGRKHKSATGRFCGPFGVLQLESSS
ncbi:hypothetical protein J3E69DRAFT_351206 [Trichoderma sp. SZMC 28015]